MEKIYFVRHGQTVWNVENKICGSTDSPLTEKGRQQAKETGMELKRRIDAGEVHIDEILCSPLSRAHDTALEIAKITGLPVRVESALREQCFGRWEGLARDSREFALARRNFCDSYAGGESMMRMAQRIYNLLDQIRLDEQKTYLLVAHNGIARIVASYFHDMSNEEFADYGIQNGQIIAYDF